MSETEIYCATLYFFTLIYVWAITVIHQRTEKIKTETIDLLIEENEGQLKEYRVCMAFCLGELMKKAISEEDYELAEICKKQILDLNEKHK